MRMENQPRSPRYKLDPDSCAVVTAFDGTDLSDYSTPRYTTNGDVIEIPVGDSIKQERLRHNSQLAELRELAVQAAGFRKLLLQQLVLNGHDSNVLDELTSTELVQYVIEMTGGFYRT